MDAEPFEVAATQLTRMSSCFLEGAPEALARYEREGLLPTDSIIRRYAKTLIDVGGGEPLVYERVAGHPLEFVPLADPARMSIGDTLRFQMLLLGEPVPAARGHASVARSIDADSAYHEVSFETDADDLRARRSPSALSPALKGGLGQALKG